MELRKRNWKLPIIAKICHEKNGDILLDFLLFSFEFFRIDQNMKNKINFSLTEDCLFFHTFSQIIIILREIVQFELWASTVYLFFSQMTMIQDHLIRVIFFLLEFSEWDKISLLFFQGLHVFISQLK